MSLPVQALRHLFRLRYGYAWPRLHAGLKRARVRRTAGGLCCFWFLIRFL
ncbi:hypothetical protein HMPREF1548_00966 [Clostridium sp. KLE 1755]|nr:hypothetical protein HMPREF1548_00966 [Clostridium sp. KLE 1755]